MRASVVVCTYNRCASLQDALRHLMKQDFPSGEMEVLVVDNNSTDGTKRVVEVMAAAAPVPLLYVAEKKQGLSHARNAGISRARGEVVIFIDDDAIAGERWLSSIMAAFDDAAVDAAGGPVKPLWECDPPRWLPAKWLPYLSVEEFSDLRDSLSFTAERCPVGTNMAFRKTALASGISFPASLGRKGAKLISNEEIVVCRQILSSGAEIRFVPEAVVLHSIPRERLHKRWFYKRVYWQGRSDALLRDSCFTSGLTSVLTWCAVILKNSVAALTREETPRFSAAMMVCLHWGKVVGVLCNLSPQQGKS